MSRIADSIKRLRKKQQAAAHKCKSRLPEPKVVRIMERHVLGESDRKIARGENVDRKTVKRITNSEKMQELVREGREKLYAAIPDAVRTVQDDLRESKSSRLAYQMLRDLGVIPTFEERTAIQTTQPPQSISDEAREKLYEALSTNDKMIFRWLKMFQIKAEAFGMSPDPFAKPPGPPPGYEEPKSPQG